VLELLESRVVPSTVYWTGAQDTNWDNPANWSTGSTPGAGDDVVVNQAGANLVLSNFSGTADTIHGFIVQATDVRLTLQYGTLDLSGGVFGAKGTLQANQAGDTIDLQAATLADADVTAGTVITAVYYYGSTLDGVQMDGTLDMTQGYGPSATVINGLTLNGEIDIGGFNFPYKSATLYFGNSGDTVAQSILGSGTVVCGADYYGDSLFNNSAGALTIGPGITIQAGMNTSIFGPIDNQGTIVEHMVGGSFSRGGSASVAVWTNDGVISAASGTTLNLYGNWTNSATGIITVGSGSTVSLGSNINIDPTDPSAPSYTWTNNGSLSIGSGSTFNLGGVFTAMTLSGLGLDSSDSVNLTGTLDNRGATLAIGGTNASWSLLGGRIYQGIITSAPGSSLVVNPNSYYYGTGTLDGVELDGVLDVTQGYNPMVTVTNGLTLNGEIDLGGFSYPFKSAVLNFGNYGDTTAQSLAGTGTVVFGADYYGDGVFNNSMGVLAIGPGITIQAGTNSYIQGLFDNQGSIQENVAGDNLSIGNSYAYVPWVNDGTISAVGGTTLNLYGNWTNSATGSITVGPASVATLGSPINIDPTDPSAPSYTWTSLGSIAIGTGSTVYLGGVFTATALATLGLDSGDSAILWGTLDNRGAALAVGGANASCTLSNGRIYRGTITTAPGSSLEVTGNSPGSTLDGVQLDGSLTISQGYFPNLTILNGLTLGGEIDIGAISGAYFGSTLNFGSCGDTADESLTGSGKIVFGTDLYGDNLVNNSMGILTIGTGITIQAGTTSSIQGLIDNQGAVQENAAGDSLSFGNWYAFVPWVNDGTISAVGGTALNLFGNWTNSATGIITVGPNSIVSLGSTVDIDPTDPSAASYAWINHGSISIGSNSTVNLGGVFTMSSIVGMGLDNTDSYNLTGTLDNSGGTLAVGGSDAMWTLAYGRIYRGTVTTAPGSALAGSGTLDGVTLNGNLDLSGINAFVNVEDGLTLNGEIDLGGTLYFGNFGGTGVSFLTGVGTIIFGSGPSYANINNRSPSTLTIGSGITILGGGNSSIFGSIDNQGTILENTVGGSLSIGDVVYGSVPWTNEGTISAASGTTLNLYGNWTNSASGIIAIGPGSVVSLGSRTSIDPTDPSAPSFAWTNNGSISIGSNSTVNLGGVFTMSSLTGLGLDNSDTYNLTGTLDNRGATLAVGGTNAVWMLSGGRIYHGTVTTAPGSVLSGGGTLDSVQLNGTANGSFGILNGLTLNGELNVGGPYGGYLSFGNYGDSAAQSVTGTGNIVFSNGYSNYLYNNSSGPLTIGPGITIQGGAGSTSLFGPIENQGTIEENTPGGLLFAFPPTNYDYSTGTLTGGTWEAGNGGNLLLYGAPITTNAATVILFGAGSQLSSNFGTADALANLSTIAAGGSLTVQGGATVNSSNAVNNLGTLVVGAGSSFSAAGGYTQSSGLSVFDGSLSALSVVLNGGVLKGTGTVQGNVINAAEVDPGDSPGTLSITGDYTQTSAGVLNVEIGGTSAGSFDQLTVSGTATLAGTLNVQNVNGFVANPGNAFPILTFGARNGDFAAENGLNTVTGQVLVPTYHSVDLTLIAKDTTTAALTSSVNPSVVGQPVTFTATIHSSGPGTGAPTGSVTFMDGTAVLGNANFNSAGLASLKVSTLPAGSHTLTATYGGDSAFLGATVSLGQTVRKDATTTAGSALASTANFGQPLTFTATVSANAPGSGTPSGSVDFYDSTTQTELGTVSLSGGSAQLTTTMLPTGSQTIVMSYGGDPNFLASNTTATVSIRESIYLLNSSASGALNVSGNATINTAGLLQVDSNSSTAVQASGYANVTAASILVVGGVHTTDHAAFHPTPITGSPYVADPFAALAAPTGGTNRGSVNLSGNSTLTINPGIYSQISVSGNAVLTLTPGLYVIAGGGMTISVNGRVTGSGVIIYNAGSNYPGPGGNFGAITMSGSSTLNLTAASTGNYVGICVFQSRDNTRTISLGGNANVRLNGGLLYAPGATLSLNVNAQIRHNPLILGQLLMSGNGASTPTNGLGTTTLAVDKVFSQLASETAGSTRLPTQAGGHFDGGKETQPADKYLPPSAGRSDQSLSVIRRSKRITSLGDLSVALRTDSLDGGILP
jgi:hypothetical protein